MGVPCEHIPLQRHVLASVCTEPPWKSQTTFASEVPGSEHRMDLDHQWSFDDSSRLDDAKQVEESYRKAEMNLHTVAKTLEM